MSKETHIEGQKDKKKATLDELLNKKNFTGSISLVISDFLMNNIVKWNIDEIMQDEAKLALYRKYYTKWRTTFWNVYSIKQRW